MYRYLVFAYGQYYPRGGMEDCVLKTNDYKEIERKIQEIKKDIDNYIEDFDEVNVYDTHTDEIIFKCEL